MPVVKHPPNPLGLCILGEFYGQYGKDPNFDAIIRYCESLEVNAYNPYHYLKRKEADRVNTVFSDIAILFGGQIKSVMQGNPVSIHDTVRFLDDAVMKGLSKAALNRQEKICVHHICDRLRRLMEEFKPPRQNTEYMLDITRHVFDLVGELQCSVCRNILSQPRIMRCGHAFCFPCIKEWFELSKFTDCPQCRNIEITGNVQKLPHLPILENVLRTTDQLAEIVSRVRYNKPDKPSKPSCAICAARPFEASAAARDRSSSKEGGGENTNDLTHSLTERDDKESADRKRQRGGSAVSEKLWYDVDLRMFLCSLCYEKQSLRTVDMHHQHPVYLDLLQDVKGESVQFCERHSFLVRAEWCNSCSTTICAVCHILEHANHCTLHLTPEEALKHAAKEATKTYDFYRLMGEKLKISLLDLMARQSGKVGAVLEAYEQLDPKYKSERGQLWAENMRRNFNAACEDIHQFLANLLHKHLEEVRICQSATQIGEGLTGKKLRQRLHVGNTRAKNIPDQMRFCKDFFASILDTFNRIMYFCDNVKLLTEEAKAGITQETVRDRLRLMAQDLTRDVFPQGRIGGKDRERRKHVHAPTGKKAADRVSSLTNAQADGSSNKLSEIQTNQETRNTPALTDSSTETTLQQTESTPPESRNITDEEKMQSYQEQGVMGEESEDQTRSSSDDAQNKVELPCDSGHVEHYMVYHTAENLVASVFEKVLAEEGIILHPTGEDEHDCSVEHGFSDNENDDEDNDVETELKMYEMHKMQCTMEEDEEDGDNDDDNEGEEMAVEIEYITEQNDENQCDEEDLSTEENQLLLDEKSDEEKQVIDNQEEPEVVDTKDKPEEVVDNQEKPEELVDNQEKPDELVDSQEKSEVVDKQEKPDELVDSQEKSEVVDNQEKPEELVGNQEKPEELVDNQEKSEELVHNQEKPEELIDNQDKPEEPSGITSSDTLQTNDVDIVEKENSVDEKNKEQEGTTNPDNLEESEVIHQGPNDEIKEVDVASESVDVNAEKEAESNVAKDQDEAEQNAKDQDEVEPNAKEICKPLIEGCRNKDQMDEMGKEANEDGSDKEQLTMKDQTKVENGKPTVEGGKVSKEVLGCGDVVMTSSEEKLKEDAGKPQNSPNKTKKNKRNNRKKNKW